MVGACSLVKKELLYLYKLTHVEMARQVRAYVGKVSLSDTARVSARLR